MINIKEKYKCCGCNSCVQICPQQCISMKEDEEGFLYPEVEIDKCINCSLCEKACPLINSNEPSKPIKVFAVKNRDITKRLQSSSGGFFITIAEQVISQGGVVFGACFNENWEVEHRYVETFDELPSLMRSKYVQSSIGNTFKEVKQFLKQGRTVLFVGTSCQIAGLKKFLRNVYENLITIDFICHGVPSPGVWRKYLNEEFGKQSTLCAATGKNLVLSSLVKEINFREKSLNGFNWEKFGFVILGKSIDKDRQNSVLLSCIHNKNPFMKGFLANIYLRPSCYHCAVKGGKASSDITIADFWGIQNINPTFYDKAGVSSVIIHSLKGLTFFEKTDIDKIDSTLEEATNINYTYYRPVSLPKNRERFFKLIKTSHTVKEAVEICIYKHPIVNLCHKVRLKFKRIIGLNK